MEQAAKINKLVSLTFDESPAVRKRAACALAEVDDPAAMFALVELSYDKDPSVRVVAQGLMDKKKQTEPELMSFAAIFSNGEEEKKDGDSVEPIQSDPSPENTAREVAAKERVLRPITQIFERHLGKEKAEMVKSKMMPSIEKVYQKTHHASGTKKKEKGNPDKHATVMQEFLTSYLEVMSDLDRIGSAPQNIPSHSELEHVQDQKVVHTPHPDASKSHLSRPPETPEPDDGDLHNEIAEVGKSEVDPLSSELAAIETSDLEEMKEREEIEHLPDTFFKKAYEVMMLSGGDEDVMKQELERMIEEAKREITQAFKMARKRFKETKITNITKIKDGMKNINTDVLTVSGVSECEFQKSKKEKVLVSRVLVTDESDNEGVLYLPQDKGILLKEGMKMQVKCAVAKTIAGETVLILSKKGNVYIVL